MVLFYFLAGKGRYYEFPFWAGIIAGGWFLPQAIAGCAEANSFPDGAYTAGMFFAAICNALICVGFELGKNKQAQSECWLDADFDMDRLYTAGAVMCVVGFFFQWKLWSLPEEMFQGSQWSGALVKYLFFASVFKMGFVVLWAAYLAKRKVMNPKFLLFIVPCLILLFNASILHGRRGEMMNLFSFVFVSIWVVRRIAIPKVMLVSAVFGGLMLINSIDIYRIMMSDKDVAVTERLTNAIKAVSEEKKKEGPKKMGSEFKNYIYTIALYREYGKYDFGGFHWNELVFNYVPGQLVGREFKKSLMLESGMSAREAGAVLLEKFGYKKSIGSTISGYADAFGSFSWFGAVKFLLIGYMMGILYRHAMAGRFLGHMLYVYVLGTAMHSISHGTNRILTSVWVYFFFLAYPLLYRARLHKSTD